MFRRKLKWLNNIINAMEIRGAVRASYGVCVGGDEIASSAGQAGTVLQVEAITPERNSGLTYFLEK